MDFLFPILLRAPVQFWTLTGSILGSAITGAVAVTVALAQISNSRHQSRLDREMNLKKQIVLEAIESFSQISVLIGSFPTIKANDFKTDPKMLAGLNKLYLVGEKELIDILTEYQGYFGQAFAEMVPLKAALDGLEIEREGALNLHKMALENFTKLSEDWKIAKTSQEKAFIRKRQNSLSLDMDKEMSVVDDCLEKWGKGQFDLIRKTLLHIEELSQLSMRAMIIARRELGLGFTEKEEKQFFDTIKKNTETARNIMLKSVNDTASLLDI